MGLADIGNGKNKHIYNPTFFDYHYNNNNSDREQLLVPFPKWGNMTVLMWATNRKMKRLCNLEHHLVMMGFLCEASITRRKQLVNEQGDVETKVYYEIHK